MPAGGGPEVRTGGESSGMVSRPWALVHPVAATTVPAASTAKNRRLSIVLHLDVRVEKGPCRLTQSCAETSAGGAIADREEMVPDQLGLASEGEMHTLLGQKRCRCVPCRIHLCGTRDRAHAMSSTSVTAACSDEQIAYPDREAEPTLHARQLRFRWTVDSCARERSRRPAHSGGVVQLLC